MMIRLSDLGDRMAKGGKREGAGRKAASEAGAAVVFAARIPPDLNADVDAFIEQRGISRAALLVAALRAYLEAHPEP